MSNPSRKSKIADWLGWPFIERGLGDKPWRNAAIAGGLTAAVLVLNAVHYIWLMGQPSWLQDYTDRRYLRMGWEGVAGVIDLEMVVVLMVGLLLIAPTLACLSVIKEAETRTIDALTITPLRPISLHNGFVFGALAKLTPWLAPALAVHIMLGATTAIDPSTAIWTTALLLLGGWGTTSLGAMVGVLMRDRVKGPLTGLMVFVLFGVAFGLPALALNDGGSEMVAYISAPGAILHALATDANALLSTIGERPQGTYQGAFLGLPIHVPLYSLPIAAFWILLSTHVSRRRLTDALQPAIDFKVAAGALAFIALAAWPLLAQEAERTVSWSATSVDRVGENAVIAASVLQLLTLPFFVILAMGVASSRDAIQRYVVASATGRGGDFERPTRSLHLLALAGVLLAMGLALPWTVDWPGIGLTEARFGDRLWVVVPFAWGIGTIVGVVNLWRLSAQKGWQTLLAWMIASGTVIITFAYMVAIVDTSSLELRDLAWDTSSSGQLLAGLVVFVLLPVPIALAAIHTARRHNLLRALYDLVEGCVPDLELAPVDGRWPEADTHTHALHAPLRRPRRAVLTPGAQLADFDALPTVDEPWLSLDGHTLRFAPARGQGEEERTIDLSRPFSVTCTRPPVVDTEHLADGNTTILQVVVAQTLQPGQSVQIGFGVAIERDAISPGVPVQQQRLAVLAARDVAPILGAIRFHGEAQGVELPRVWA